MKLVTVKEMRSIEQESDRLGHTYADMMASAGRGLGAWVDKTYGEAELRTVLGLVGTGNNGGDTLVALNHLLSQGWYAFAYLVRPRAEGDPLVDAFAQSGGIVLDGADDPDFQRLESHLQQSSVLLDGILGTGIQLPLKPEVSRMLAWVKNFLAGCDPLSEPFSDSRVVCHPHVVAVDCPSGVNCDTGEAAGETLAAEATVCMSAAKMGLVTFPAFPLVGRLVAVDIGLPEGMATAAAIKRSVVDPAMVKAILPVRDMSAHKGTFGTALVVAGSINYTGAAWLAGRAAYRIGAGLVTLAVPEPLYHVLAGQFPEATWVLLPHHSGVLAPGAEEILRQAMPRITSLLMGPGWGLENETLAFLSRFLQVDTPSSQPGTGFVHFTAKPAAGQPASLPPVVMDADGLKLLARIPDWARYLPAPAVLTPHPGEMAVLTGLPVDEIQANRFSIAETYAQKWGHVVVLKGALTVVASPDGRSALIPVATPALARAGTGDVLAGVIAGLRAQGVGAFESALAGAWIHAQAGLAAADSMGNTASVLAGDVLNAIPRVINQLIIPESQPGS